MLVSAELRAHSEALWAAFHPVYDKNHFIKGVRKEIVTSTGIKGLGPKNRNHVADLIQSTLFEGVNTFNVTNEALVGVVEDFSDVLHPNTRVERFWRCSALSILW